MAKKNEGPRAASLRAVAKLGFPKPPPHFPPLEPGELRTQKAVVDRAIALNVVINCAYLMPTAVARAWLKREKAKLTPTETKFIDGIDAGGVADSNDLKIQIEAQWVLSWALGYEDELDFGAYCGDQLAKRLPDLRKDESRARFENGAKLRDRDELHAALDLAYCLTWGAANANLTKKDSPGVVRQYVLWERRRALEWLFGGDWDEPPTDT